MLSHLTFQRRNYRLQHAINSNLPFLVLSDRPWNLFRKSACFYFGAASIIACSSMSRNVQDLECVWLQLQMVKQTIPWQSLTCAVSFRQGWSDSNQAPCKGCKSWKQSPRMVECLMSWWCFKLGNSQFIFVCSWASDAERVSQLLFSKMEKSKSLNEQLKTIFYSNK